MKNRTVIGIICMVLAVVMTFVIAPIVNRITSDTAEVVRLSEDVGRGTQITEEHLEMATVKSDTLPAGVINDAGSIIGKYATSDLYAGDYLTEQKLSGEANGAEDVLASLDGTKVAVSVTIQNFAAGLSGKLENGDVISFVIVDSDNNKSTIPAELKYVRVITATTGGGIDKDSIVKNEDGSYEIPTTITVLVNTTQAKLLAMYEDEYTIRTALVYRGTTENCKKFLDAQDEYFAKNPEKEESEVASDAPTDEKANDNDPIKKANDIINGNAGYYDVEAEVSGNE